MSLASIHFFFCLLNWDTARIIISCWRFICKTIQVNINILDRNLNWKVSWKYTVVFRFRDFPRFVIHSKTKYVFFISHETWLCLSFLIQICKKKIGYVSRKKRPGCESGCQKRILIHITAIVRLKLDLC